MAEKRIYIGTADGDEPPMFLKGMTMEQAISYVIRGVEDSGEVGCFDEIQWVGGFKDIIAEKVVESLLKQEND